MNNQVEDNGQDWKFGVSVASFIILFGAYPFLITLFPEILSSASDSVYDSFWNGYTFLMHLAILLQLKISRTLYIKYHYIVINDAVMAIIISNLIDRLFGCTDIRILDFVGLFIGSLLFVAKHYKWIRKWALRVKKFYRS
jgi:hypothetical protein